MDTDEREKKNGRNGDNGAAVYEDKTSEVAEPSAEVITAVGAAAAAIEDAIHQQGKQGERGARGATGATGPAAPFVTAGKILMVAWKVAVGVVFVLSLAWTASTVVTHSMIQHAVSTAMEDHEKNDHVPMNAKMDAMGTDIKVLNSNFNLMMDHFEIPKEKRAK